MMDEILKQFNGFYCDFMRNFGKHGAALVSPRTASKITEFMYGDELFYRSARLVLGREFPTLLAGVRTNIDKHGYIQTEYDIVLMTAEGYGTPMVKVYELKLGATE